MTDRDWSGGIVRYPDPAIEIIDEERFGSFRIGNAVIELLWTGARWTEGPVYFGDGGCLLFSDIPNNRILRYDEETGQVSLYRKPSNWQWTHARPPRALINCEHFTRRVTRTEHDGTLTVLIDAFEGKKLNAPNDVVVHSDGSIGLLIQATGFLYAYEGQHAEFELPTRVYRIDGETGEATVAIEEMDMPNGLCFSPDESLLYVSDTGDPENIRVYNVDGAHLNNGRVFAEMSPGKADGIRCDVHGNLWSSAGWVGGDYDGVHCFAPDGALIGKIHLPEIVSNLCFGGGPKKNRLYMTGSQSLYAVYLETKGAQTP